MLSKTWDDAPNFMLAHVVNKVRYVELHYDLWIDISRLKTAFIHCVFIISEQTNVQTHKLINQSLHRYSIKTQ